MFSRFTRIIKKDDDEEYAPILINPACILYVTMIEDCTTKIKLNNEEVFLVDEEFEQIEKILDLTNVTHVILEQENN